MCKNLIFTKNEYQQRIRKTKEMMDKGGMEMGKRGNNHIKRGRAKITY